ncbi:peptidoglycan-binding protein [Streptomyces sp. GbtcB6]|uniref:peptidoglycan-binding domain-containing protein n=1 Tax=Streptomyces sp. GbtcB6 TaxID=2824751 RepID=UPI001C309D66|nr:peptidoglycan-binding domain-containing protein [Streptomyces sp. GbtcB6]
MTDTTGGHQCPECGTPKGPDGSPFCDCNQRTSDALRDARTAEQAAAEDFDPLRIRPYVAIAGDPGDAADGAETSPLPVTAPVKATAEVTVPLRAVPADAAPEAPEGPRRRPRWALLLAVAGAVIGILAVAGFASGLFAHATPTRDRAAPADVRESVPDVTPSTASPSAAAPVTSPRSARSSSPSGSASPSASHSPSPAPSSAAPSPSPSRSATPTESASTTGTAASARPTSAPVLRPGDTGAEVTELQQRLTQLNLYTGTADGHYDTKTEDAVRTYQLARGILTDEAGVYGTATRAALESETTEP